jgi:triosephosphate isomerase
MLVDLGCKYVIIGHNECRRNPELAGIHPKLAPAERG